MMPEDLELKIKQAKTAHMYAEATQSQAKLLLKEQNDMCTIPLNVMLAEMEGKLKELIQKTRDGSKRQKNQPKAKVPNNAQNVTCEDISLNIKYSKNEFGEYHRDCRINLCTWKMYWAAG